MLAEHFQSDIDHALLSYHRGQRVAFLDHADVLVALRVPRRGHLLTRIGRTELLALAGNPNT